MRTQRRSWFWHSMATCRCFGLNRVKSAIQDAMEGKIMKTFRLVRLAIGIAILFAGTSLAADPATVNWNSVPTKTVTLFYPAQSTYQWLRSSAHPGAPVVTGGGACLTCHNGAEEKLGNKLVTANPLEPTPVAGKNGVIQLNLQIAYDNENAYFRAQWKTRNPYPGEAHPFVRYRRQGMETVRLSETRCSCPKGRATGDL